MLLTLIIHTAMEHLELMEMTTVGVTCAVTIIMTSCQDNKDTSLITTADTSKYDHKKLI